MSVRILRPLNRLVPLLIPKTTLSRPPQRHFLFNPLGSSTQTIEAHRTLPYSTLDVYTIIADIEAYPQFLPYCRKANITEWSQKDPHHNRTWPQEAVLTVGYGDTLTESFGSRVFCAPPVPEQGRAGIGIVEAVSGQTDAQMDEGLVKHHDHKPREHDEFEKHPSSIPGGSPLAMLQTRWTVKNFMFKPGPAGGYKAQEEGGKLQGEAKQMTDVSLSIQFKFKSPVYEMMAKAVTPKLADVRLMRLRRG